MFSLIQWWMYPHWLSQACHQDGLTKEMLGSPNFGMICITTLLTKWCELRERDESDN